MGLCEICRTRLVDEEIAEVDGSEKAEEVAGGETMPAQGRSLF